MQAEWESYLSPELVAALCADGTSVSGLCSDEEPVDIETEFFSVTLAADNIITFPALPATAKVLNLLGLTNKGPEASLTINSQPPETDQDFHMDNRVVNDRVVIIHGGDAGAFDYSPSNFYDRRNPQSARAIELDAGDVVIQTLPYLLHRGRNRGNQRRFTFAHSANSDQPYIAPQTPHGLDSLGRELISQRL